MKMSIIASQIDAEYRMRKHYERRNRMEKYNKTGKVLKSFNCKLDGVTYEEGETFTADRFEYDILASKGFVDKGEKVDNK